MSQPPQAVGSGNTGSPGDIQFVDLHWNGHPLRLETQWVGEESSRHPVVVFLHEGLGSIAQWRDFPDRFCKANGLRGFVYSRYGYGRSTPRPAAERWGCDFMHRQAGEVLPMLLVHAGIRMPWLFGHSDGGSIALLYAARFPDQVSGVVALAPHVFTEEISVRSIEAVRATYLATQSADAPQPGLRARLSRYHDDPDSAFWGWNDAWLASDFRHWNIASELASIRCSLLLMQGENDEYGTLEQLDRIQRAVPHAHRRVLPDCGHSPQRDQAESVIQEAGKFITQHLP